MKIYRMNENAELPTYATEGSAAFDIKSCFKNGDKLRAYNNWNKEVFITVKGVGQNPNSFQLPPDTRILIPTGLIFDVPDKHVLKMFIKRRIKKRFGISKWYRNHRFRLCRTNLYYDKQRNRFVSSYFRWRTSCTMCIRKNTTSKTI